MTPHTNDNLKPRRKRIVAVEFRTQGLTHPTDAPQPSDHPPPKPNGIVVPHQEPVIGGCVTHQRVSPQTMRAKGEGAVSRPSESEGGTAHRGVEGAGGVAGEVEEEGPGRASPTPTVGGGVIREARPGFVLRRKETGSQKNCSTMKIGFIFRFNPPKADITPCGAFIPLDPRPRDGGAKGEGGRWGSLVATAPPLQCTPGPRRSSPSRRRAQAPIRAEERWASGRDRESKGKTQIRRKR